MCQRLSVLWTKEKEDREWLKAQVQFPKRFVQLQQCIFMLLVVEVIFFKLSGYGGLIARSKFSWEARKLMFFLKNWRIVPKIGQGSYYGGVYVCIFVPNIELTQHSTGLSLGNQVDGLPGVWLLILLHWHFEDTAVRGYLWQMQLWTNRGSRIHCGY